MRSPNQAEIKDECQKLIPLLLAKFGLSYEGEIQRDENGWVNPCFFIGSQFVVRFNARDPSLPKFQREKFVYDLLQASGVPVPKKVWLDDSKEICRFDVLISERLPGSPIEPDWLALSEETRVLLAEQAGSLLARLHNQRFDFFGELTRQGPLPTSSKWVFYLREKLLYHLEEAKKHKIFTSDEHFHLLDILDRNAEYLDIQDSRLVHVDFHFGNILYFKQKITGVLDFEWALAGDPIYDLCRWMNPLHEDWVGSRKSFLKGYGQSEFTDDQKKRAKIYQMIQNVELTVVAKLHFDDNEFNSYRKTTLASLT